MLARGLGQEEGAQAIKGLIDHLTQLMEQMYREGIDLNQKYIKLEAVLNEKRNRASQWVEKTRGELQKEAQLWIQNRKAELDQQFTTERNKWQATFQKEKDSLEDQYK